MKLTPLGDKVIGKMIDGFGEKVTAGGVIFQEENGTDRGARARWFEITHVGPDQTDVVVGDYVLVAHSRWSRGINVDNTLREEDKLFRIDAEEMLGISDCYPL